MMKTLVQRAAGALAGVLAGVWTCALLSSATALAQPAEPAVEFFVAPDGNDRSPGTLEQPFGTLEGARNAIRALRADGGLPAGGVAVNLRAGFYHRTGTFELTAADAATEEAPVVYRAYPGEEVIITGARRVAGFVPVTDPAVLERLDESARGHVLQADLPAQGITDFGELRHRGMAQPIRPAALELLFDGRPMQLARWPNEGFVMTGEVIATGSRAFSRGGPMGVIQPHEREEPQPGEFVFDDDRLLRWVDAEDAWLHGYFGRDWSDEHLGVQSIDPDKRTISPAQPTRYGHYPDKRFYVLNVPAELDRPGEWYLDRHSGMLYFWPPAPIDEAEVQVTVLEQHLLSLRDVSHVTLQGLILEGGRADAVRISGGESNLVLGCTIRCMGNRAVVVSQGRNHRVVGCDIHDTGDGAVFLTGGDRVTLQPSGHLAENNHIHNYARWCRTYRAAVSLHGVGNTARHNLIHSAAHYAVTMSGNDNLFELNEVHSVVRETTDSASLYMGMNPTFRGNVIRHNFFHHIGSALTHSGQAAVYFDDGASGSHIYGNIFWRVGGAGTFGAAMVHGGKDNVFENNIFAECRRGMTFAGWSEEVWAAYLASDRIQGLLAQVSATEPPYITRYPELGRLEGNPCVNQVRRNVAYRCEQLITGRSADRQEVEGNITIEQDPGFAGIEAGARRLRDDTAQFREIGFEPIPLERIGLYEDVRRASWPVEHEVLPVPPAGPPPAPRAHPAAPLRVPRVETAPVVDGVVREGEWPVAAVTMREDPGRNPVRGAPATARVAHDTETLYVAITVPISDPAKLQRGDAWRTDDGMEVCFRSLAGDRPGPTFVVHGMASGTHESVTEAGAPAEAARRLGEQARFAAQVGRTQWTGEFAIPLAAAGIQYRPGLRLGFNMGVFRSESREWVVWTGALGPSWNLSQAGSVVLE